MICIPSLPRTKRAAFAMARQIGRDAAALIASPDVAHQPTVQRMKPLPLLAAKLRAPPHRTHKAPSRAGILQSKSFNLGSATAGFL